MLTAYAEREGYKVLEVFEDKAKTATKMLGRDELERAIDAVITCKKSRPDAQVALVVQDVDRLARNELDYQLILKDLNDAGIILLSMNQPGINDSIEGLLQGGIVSLVAAYSSRLTGRKVKNMAAQMVRKGLTTFKAPLGYNNVNRGTIDNPDRGHVELDPDAAPKVRRVFEDYATGQFSLPEVAERANADGLRSKSGNLLQRSTIEQIIKNPFFIGKLRCKGEVIDGEHVPLIDDTLFARCRAVLSEHGHHSSRKRIPENHAKFFLKKFLRCGMCGYDKITGECATGRSKRYDYYRCIRPKKDPAYHSNRGGCADMLTIEGQVESFFGLFVLSPDVMQEVVERAKTVLTEMHGHNDKEKDRLDAEMKRLEKQRQTYEIKLGDGLISDEVFERNHKRIEAEMRTAKLRIAEIESTRKDNSKLFVALVKLARNLPYAYLKSSPEVKKMYLTVFWEYFDIAGQEITKAVPSKAIIALLNENLISLRNASAGDLILIRKIWLPDLDSNQEPSR